jgi:hypothetical protein
MERKMILSPELVGRMKHFSTINKGIEFKKGNKLSTISPSKTVLAEVTLKDAITENFCIGDLTEFMTVSSMYDPEIIIDGTDIHFNKNARKSKTKFRQSEKSVMILPPEKMLVLPSIDCSFSVTAEDLEWILKNASILSSVHIAVESDGDTISISTFDAKNDSSHINSTEIGEGNGKSFKIVFSVENLKIIPGPYDVNISMKGFSHFKNTKEDIQYWIALEKNFCVFGN